jgi:hypothetical protein
MECNNKEGHYICDACDYLRTQPGYIHRPFEAEIEKQLTDIVHMGSPTKLIMP